METPIRPRLWPAWMLILIAAALVATTPFLVPRTMLHFIGLLGGPILATLGILVWWVVASRSRGLWRWLPVLAYVVPCALICYVYYSDPPKYLLLPLLYLAPCVALFWVGWVTLNRRTTPRSGSIIVVILLGWALTLLVHIDGTDAEMVPELRWAWHPTTKELFERELAARQRNVASNVAVTIGTGDWPEFRGSIRDGMALDPIRANWDANPPKQLWRQRVGAGWGSFAITGDYAFTQEQRGSDEAVVCYAAKSGVEIWEARVPGLFTEPIAKEGPRATPTIHDGKVYAFGATGKLVALDAATGKQLWLRDVCPDVGASVPQWGFASSPLVIDGKVIVFAAAEKKGTVAYTLEGSLAWANGRGLHGYSSPQRYSFEGKEYVLQVSDYGLEAFDPKTGEARGEFAWTLRGQNRVAQPAILDEKSILLGTAVGGDQGARLLGVTASKGVLQFAEIWKSKAPRPYFNDGVVFEKHYYGWDDRNFVCVDLKNGKVKWNAGSGYGFGQVLLLPSQKLLLVQTEKGDVALVEATPEDHNEIAKFPALKDKTWNHPVLAHGKLYVRNGVEAACYDVSEIQK